MKPRPGEALELLIDDTRIAKRARKIACLQKIWDYKQQRFVIGHIVVVGAIRFRGVVFPWRVVLWRPKAAAGTASRKFTEIAAAMIASLPPGWGMKVRVMFDAFSLCPLVVNACEKQGYTWFSVAARNRRFRRDRGRRASIGQLASGWLRHSGHNVHMPRARGVARMRLTLVRGHLSRIGNVRIVISKRIGDPWKNVVAFVTNERGLEARKIVSIYEGRWAIEILFKELRNDLGRCEYQVLEERAMVRHLHLCALSHLRLTHHAMAGVGAQARKANQHVALEPMSQRLDALRTEVRRDQVHRVLRGKKHRRLRMKIERYFLKAAA